MQELKRKKMDKILVSEITNNPERVRRLSGLELRLLLIINNAEKNWLTATEIYKRVSAGFNPAQDEKIYNKKYVYDMLREMRDKGYFAYKNINGGRRGGSQSFYSLGIWGKDELKRIGVMI